MPGFFATLRGAMSDIPSSQPVTDELNWVIEFNERVRRLARDHRQRAAAGQPSWSRASLPARSTARSTAPELRAWREQVNSQVARDAGFAYQAYVRLKLASVRAFGAQLIVKLRGAPAQSPLSRVVAEIIDAWAVRKGIVYVSDRKRGAANSKRATAAQLPGLGQLSAGLRRASTASGGCIS